MARSTRAMANAAETVSTRTKKLSKREKEEIQERVRLTFQGGIVSPAHFPRGENAPVVENDLSTMEVVSTRGIKRKASAMIMDDKPKSKREKALIEGKLLAEEWAFQPYGIPKKLAVANKAAYRIATMKTLGTPESKGCEDRAKTLNRVAEPHVPVESPSIRSTVTFASDVFLTEATFTEASGNSEPTVQQDLSKAHDLIVEWVGKALAMLNTNVEENSDMTGEIAFTGLVAGVTAIAVLSIDWSEFKNVVLAIAVAFVAIKLRPRTHRILLLP